MKILDNIEMKRVDGGANGILIGTVVAVIVSFISGILSGYSNPKKCN